MLVQHCPGLHAQRAPLMSLGNILGHNCSLPASQPDVLPSSSRKCERKRGRRGLAVVGSLSNGSEPSPSSNGASPSSKGKGSAPGKSLDERILSGEVRGSAICKTVPGSWVPTSLAHQQDNLLRFLRRSVLRLQFTDQGSTKERITRPIRKALAKDPVGPGD